MYDLCTRPEQPAPAPAHTEMESGEVAEALGRQQRESGKSDEQDSKQHGLSEKAAPTTANVTSASLLGKRHHSLYANLNGFEVEGVRKVSVEHFLSLVDMKMFWALKTCKWHLELLLTQ